MVAFTGVILAGGQSRRMGKDKALLQLGGETLLDRAYALLLDAGADQVLISRNDHLPGHTLDRFPNKGPLAGIHAAICESGNRPMLFVPVDLPLLNTNTLKRLVWEGIGYQTSVCYEGQSLPLLLYRPDDILQALESTLTAGKHLAVGRFFSQFPIRAIKLRHEDELLNTNTPDEWFGFRFRCLLNKFREINHDTYQ